MEPNSWLVLATIGLTLDICGTILIVVPVFKKYQFGTRWMRYHVLRRSLPSTLDRLSRHMNAQNQIDLLKNEIRYTDKKVKELSDVITGIYKTMSEESDQEQMDKSQAKFGLILLVVGFSLQIFSNAIK